MTAIDQTAAPCWSCGAAGCYADRAPPTAPPAGDLDELERLAREALAATGPRWRAGNAARHQVFCHDPDALGGPVLGERVVCTANAIHPAHAGGEVIARYIAAAAPPAVLELIATARGHDAELRHALTLRGALLEALDAWGERDAWIGRTDERIAEIRRLCERPIPAPRTCPDHGPHYDQGEAAERAAGHDHGDEDGTR